MINQSTSEKRAIFRRLHERGCFLLPNPWDAGSARYLQGLGFKALASTSAGFAWSTGHSDTAVAIEPVLEHLRTLVAATDLPVNADFESGYAEEPDGVEDNVRLALETGVAGLSIEDSTGDIIHPLEVAVERIRAARRAFDKHGGDAMLIGRAENFRHGHKNLEDTIARLCAYADAGADCLYAPAIKTREQIQAIVNAVAPKPVNLLVNFAIDLTFDEIVEIGVRRISAGPALARAAWSQFMHTAASFARGDFQGFAAIATRQQLDSFFRISEDRRLNKRVARVVGKVEFREGEEEVTTVPVGAIEVQTTPTVAVLSWSNGPDHKLAAIPVANFCAYVDEGKIVLGGKPD